VRTMGSMALRWIVFLVVFIVGAALSPADRSLRALAVGALIVVLVLCGVFAPNFSMQILNGVLAAAIFLVLVIWVVAFFFRKRLPGLGQLMRPVSPATEPPLPGHEGPAAVSVTEEAKESPPEEPPQEPPEEEPVDVPTFEETDQETDEGADESGGEEPSGDEDAKTGDSQEGGRNDA